MNSSLPSILGRDEDLNFIFVNRNFYDFSIDNLLFLSAKVGTCIKWDKVCYGFLS